MKDLYGFKVLTGDINFLDYGGKWFRHLAGTREYHVIESLNWEESVGEREAKEVGYTYNLSLSIVDLNALSEDQIKSAMDSCGWTPETEGITDEWLVEACHGYGSRAPMNDTDTNNFYKTFRELARYSRELSSHHAVKDLAMRKPVNKIGSTADEFMRGDLNSAILRGLETGDPAANILAKMGMLR